MCLKDEPQCSIQAKCGIFCKCVCVDKQLIRDGFPDWKCSPLSCVYLLGSRNTCDIFNALKKVVVRNGFKNMKIYQYYSAGCPCPVSMSQYGLTKEREREDEVDLKQSRYILALQQFSGGGVTQFQNSSKDGKHMASLGTIGTSSHFCGLSNWVVSGLSHLAVLLTARFARLVHRTGPVTVKQN